MSKENLILRAEHLDKSFPPLAGQAGGHIVLQDLSLEVQEGEFLSILGKSGCGKSTLLRILGGFDPPDRGKVTLGEQPVQSPGSRMIMIFQESRQLFPWMTLMGNIVYAIKKTARSVGKEQAAARAAACLSEVGLAGYEQSYPHELSGGMKQRAALARALALEPAVLLMDEPFSSLDYLTRRSAQDTLLRLWRERGVTVVFVTHDIDEALTLSQQIAVFDHAAHRLGESFQNDGSPALKGRLEALLREREEREWNKSADI